MWSHRPPSIAATTGRGPSAQVARNRGYLAWGHRQYPSAHRGAIEGPQRHACSPSIASASQHRRQACATDESGARHATAARRLLTRRNAAVSGPARVSARARPMRASGCRRWQRSLAHSCCTNPRRPHSIRSNGGVQKPEGHRLAAARSARPRRPGAFHGRHSERRPGFRRGLYATASYRSKDARVRPPSNSAWLSIVHRTLAGVGCPCGWEQPRRSRGR